MFPLANLLCFKTSRTRVCLRVWRLYKSQGHKCRVGRIAHGVNCFGLVSVSCRAGCYFLRVAKVDLLRCPPVSSSLLSSGSHSFLADRLAVITFKMPLKDYQEIVGSTAALVTIAQFFSPLFICKKIVSQGNTNNVDAMPFVGGIGIGLLFLRHGYLLNDPAMVPVNLCAIGLNMVYLLVFLFYSDCRGAVVTNVVKSVIGACALMSYTFLDTNNERVLTVYGTMVTGLMFALIAAPLKDLKEIIRNQDTGSLPFPMILSGTIVMSLWLLYGIILENVFIIIQNGVGLILSGVQLSLFVIYPSKPAKKID